MSVIFLDQSFKVIAVFLSDIDAKLFESASNHKHCAMPFNVSNRDNTPLPRVGETYTV